VSKVDRRSFECWFQAVDSRLLDQYGVMTHEVGLTEDDLRKFYDKKRMSPHEFVEWYGRQKIQRQPSGKT